jgi:DNA-binding CsgD family transcriptional regulator
MHLSDDKLPLVRELIVKLYTCAFEKALVLDTAGRVCSLIDAHYFSLYLFPSRERSRLFIISNNPPEYIPVYLSVRKKDYIIESIIAERRECVLKRMPDYDESNHREFNFTALKARPISDVVYIPIIIGGRILGHWSVARAGLRSPIFTDDELTLNRFIISFLNDAFGRSLLPPPVDEDLAYLDYDGLILGSGDRIQEAFDTLFGRTPIGEASEGGALFKLFRDRYNDFLRGPFRIGMDRLELRASNRRFSFVFCLLKHGFLPHRQEGIPYASVRLLENSPISIGAAPVERVGALERFEFTRRERDVLVGIFKGKTNKEIAWTLGIDESTVKRYTHNIYEKTGFCSRVELVLGLPVI